MKSTKKVKPVRFGKYLLLERLGIGGMAEVFLGKTAGFDQPLALKRVLPFLAEDDDFIKMFTDEARVSSLLSHPEIVQVFDFGKQDETFYLATEYLAGRDLRAALLRCTRRSMLFPPALAAHVAAKVCGGLAYAHRRKDLDGSDLNIVHRDISPPNIIFGWQGEVKIIDFGVAKSAARSERTRVGMLRGKVAYMSPEQAQGKEVDQRSDLFAMGAVLYQMLTGQQVNRGATDAELLRNARDPKVLKPTTLNSAIPRELEKVLLRSLALEKEERYANALEFRDALISAMPLAAEPDAPAMLGDFLQRIFDADFLADQLRLAEFAAIEVTEQPARRPAARASSGLHSTRGLLPPPVPSPPPAHGLSLLELTDSAGLPGLVLRYVDEPAPVVHAKDEDEETTANSATDDEAASTQEYKVPGAWESSGDVHEEAPAEGETTKVPVLIPEADASAPTAASPDAESSGPRAPDRAPAAEGSLRPVRAASPPRSPATPAPPATDPPPRAPVSNPQAPSRAPPPPAVVKAPLTPLRAQPAKAPGLAKAAAAAALTVAVEREGPRPPVEKARPAPSPTEAEVSFEIEFDLEPSKSMPALPTSSATAAEQGFPTGVASSRPAPQLPQEVFERPPGPLSLRPPEVPRPAGSGPSELPLNAPPPPGAPTVAGQSAVAAAARAGDERRAFPRVPVGLSVFHSEGHQSMKDAALDVSLSGIALTTRALLLPGAERNFTLSSPDGATEIPFVGEAVHVRSVEGAAPYLTGIRILRMEPAVVPRYEALVIDQFFGPSGRRLDSRLPFRASVFWKEPGARPAVTADLVEFGFTGATLVLDAELGKGKRGLLTLPSPVDSRLISLAASVDWVKAEEGVWRVSVRFAIDAEADAVVSTLIREVLSTPRIRAPTTERRARGVRVGGYLCHTPIYRGSNCEVFAGVAVAGPFAGRKVALKHLLPEIATPQVAAAFMEEAELLKCLDHAVATPTLAALRFGDECWQVTEKVDGKSLSQLISVYAHYKRPPPVAAALSVMSDVGRVLSYRRAAARALGVPRGNICMKPSGIMLGRDGRTKVVDFGRLDLLEEPGRPRKSYAYLPPEAWAETEDETGEVFVVAVLLYEALTAVCPFRGSTLEAMNAAVRRGAAPMRKLNPEVPSGIADLVATGLALEPKDRPQRLLSFFADLAKAAPFARGDEGLKLRAWFGDLGSVGRV